MTVLFIVLPLALLASAVALVVSAATVARASVESSSSTRRPFTSLIITRRPGIDSAAATLPSANDSGVMRSSAPIWRRAGCGGAHRAAGVSATMQTAGAMIDMSFPIISPT